MSLYQIVLRAERHPDAPEVRLRALLKRARRDGALRCVEILQLDSPEEDIKKISEAFPSKYLRADDVDAMGGEVTYTVRKAVMEEIGQDRTEKPIVYFRESPSGLVLNRTNATRLASSLGDDTAGWTGKQITLETEQVPTGGRMVNSIRVRVDGEFREERRPPTASEAARAAQQPLDQSGNPFDALDDEVPF
jgi:hypothetical protein